MFSKEMEDLIKITLQDGVLTDQEKNVLIKRAQKEGIDIDELDVYIQSLLQERQQKQQKEAEAAAKKEMAARKRALAAQDIVDLENEKKRRGNVCPHCFEPIPPLTKICPNCHKAIHGNESSGDKNLSELVDKIIDSIASLQPELSDYDSDSYHKKKGKCEALLKKAEVLYGDNEKVQNLVSTHRKELADFDKKWRKEWGEDTNWLLTIGALVLDSWWQILLVIIIIVVLIKACS